MNILQLKVTDIAGKMKTLVMLYIELVDDNEDASPATMVCQQQNKPLALLADLIC